MKTLLRSAAISVASVALIAGGTTSATAAPGDGAAVTSIALQPASLPSDSNAVIGAIAITPGISSLSATVNVNGVPVASNVSIRPGGFYYERAWGAGTVTLNNFIASGRDAEGFFSNRSIPSPANAVAVRYAIKNGDGAQIRKRGKKLTFKVKLRYVNNAGKSVGIRKASLQAKKGSKWRTVKNLKLKKNGTVTYKRSDKKKRSYRLVIKTTGAYQGATFKSRGKI